MSNSIKIKIRWGSAGESTKTYQFETEEQKAFFMKGVDEAEGWLKYEILEEERADGQAMNAFGD